MSKNWRKPATSDPVRLEVLRLRLLAEAQLTRDGRRPKLSQIDALLCASWYRIPPDVMNYVWAVTEARRARKWGPGPWPREWIRAELAGEG